ncbi:MAG: hypothetical protein KDI30_06110 [Pseudomonadales bacterium]|nr:hypothetical protein [Pseudomonadales bacterium]
MKKNHHQGSATKAPASLNDLCANFPERCPACGEIHTTLLDHHQSATPDNPFQISRNITDHGELRIEARFRCGCGHETKTSTPERRDHSEKGIKRRKTFDELMAIMMAKGIKKGQAKMELLKVVRGEESYLISKVLHPR